jgi:hypothetical protein
MPRFDQPIEPMTLGNMPEHGVQSGADVYRAGNAIAWNPRLWSRAGCRLRCPPGRWISVDSGACDEDGFPTPR